ncbi:MAG: cation:proton antiporter [Planctomycetes bacterium]|nr:cation:proton antiporter [Planctomycetota bacterium]
MQHADLILTLTGGLTAALILGYLTNRIGLSPIVGYLLAGIAVGPHTPGFVANQEIAEQLSEIGIILLMFGVGLHFHPRELLAVRKVAIPGALGQCLFATALGLGVGFLAGWEASAGLVFGLAISVASTVVLLRVLADRDDLHTPAGHLAVGWLIVEDLLTVIVLVLLPALIGPQAAERHFAVALAICALKVLALGILTVFVGSRVIPWLLEIVARTKSRELFTLAILVLALGIAVSSAQIFGVSAALGAFLAGMIVGRSDFSLRATAEALPMRDAFAVLFFVSVGMLFDGPSVWQNPGLVLATISVILLGKPLAALVIVLALKQPLKVAITVALALAQIGEFSFILVNLAREMEVLSQTAANLLVVGSIVSITLNPLLYRLALPMERWLRRHIPICARIARPATAEASGPTPGPTGAAEATPYRAVVVGYGPVGETVTRLLRENNVQVTIIELNLETVRRLRHAGLSVVYGDAGQTETLHSADVAHASSLILGAASVGFCQQVIQQARELNPSIRILARVNYVSEIPAIRAAGANRVFSDEGEVALSLIEEILGPLGASREQIDRERERFWSEFDQKKSH